MISTPFSRTASAGFAADWARAASGASLRILARFELKEGYHVHSNEPSEDYFIATVLTVTNAPGATAGKVVYPKGKSYPLAGLDKPLSIFEKEFTLEVPVTLTPAAVLPVKLPAVLAYQACQGARCYPPRKLKLDLTVDRGG